MPSKILFLGPRQAILQEAKLPPLKPDNLLLRSRASLISTGTELTAFGHNFEPGTHWDSWVKYPFHPGYATVAQIEQIGKSIRSFKIGDRVVARVPHASHHVVKETQIIFVPDMISDEEAVWFALAKIALAGFLVANVQIGTKVVVVGAGPLGQMVVRWAAISPVSEIVAIDRNKKRLAIARRGGATGVIAMTLERETDLVITALSGSRPEVIFDCTGNPAVLTHALRLVADHGKIVILGDTGFPSAQCLTSDVVLRNISIIGAHDLHTSVKWKDEREVFQLFFRFLARGRFPTDHLLTHRFGPREAQKAYLLAEKRKGDTCGILFDWKGMQ